MRLAKPAWKRVLAIVCVLGGMAFVSFAPQPGARPAAICFICGERALADAVLNMAFYVPLGILVGATRLSFFLGLVAAALLSVGVEGLQLLIPGRFPSPLDVLSNSAGAALGILVARTPSSWMFPSAGLAWPLGAAAAGLFFLGAVATGWLAAPDLSTGTYVGQWTPTLGRYEPYGGNVRRVLVGTHPLPSTTVENSDEVRTLLLGGEPLSIWATAGHSPSSLSPIFGLVRQFRDQLLLVGARGDDLVLRIRHRGADWLLNRPTYYAHGLMAAVESGSDVHIEVWLCGRRTCVSVDERPGFSLALTVGEGWSLLAGPPASKAQRALLSFAWLAFLTFPSGFWLRRGAPHLVGPALLVTAAAVAPSLTSLAPTPPLQWAAIVIGVGLGVGARRLLQLGEVDAWSAERVGSRSASGEGNDSKRSAERVRT